MTDDHVRLFPVCIRKYRGIVKLYIPAVDMETRASDNADALNKARKLIQSAMILNEINTEMLSKDICSAETIADFLKKRGMDEYLDAQIVFIEQSINRYELGDLTAQLPQYLIDDVKREGIDYNEIIKSTLEEILRRKRLFNEIKEWTGRNVEVNNDFYIGEIKSINYKKDTPWNFSITLKTGISEFIRLSSAVIEDIAEIPVVINELGTFHTVNQGGLISIAGNLWWKKGHIDVYLEYDSSVEIENQQTYAFLSEYNATKYELDEVVRQNIAKQLINKEEVLRLFEDYEETNPQKRLEHILDQLINRTELWFIDISANRNVYMDYNFSNGVGEFNVGVTKRLGENSFMFTLKKVTIFSDLPDKEDEFEDEPEEGFEDE